MTLDQLLVAFFVLAASAFLLQRQWRLLRRSSSDQSCGGGCGCTKIPKRLQR